MLKASVMGKRSNEAGFTLIEIAVVLVIVGLLVGSFIGTLADRIDDTRRDNTKRELDEIKRVLIAYAFTQSPPHLPCPDTDVSPDGLEDRVLGNCVATGYLPWGTLGVGFADAWDNRYRYWVNTDYANDIGFLLSTNDVNSGTVNTRIGNLKQEIINNAVAVVYSHGKNMLGGHSVDDVDRAAIPGGAAHFDELENTDLDRHFMSRTPREEGASAINGGIYDDITVWISSYELKAKMVEAGVLP
jgi:prepilin-type N-terminal cleavage/methylation domain-containing protein